jgi:hypothetical protein
VIIILISLLYAAASGLTLSVATLYLTGRKKARLGKNNAACLVGAFIGVLIWVVFVHSIFSNSTNLIHLALFLAGATPIAALPALIFYGPGKK